MRGIRKLSVILFIIYSFPGALLWGQLQFSAGSWDFGQIEEGLKASSTFEVENRGSKAYRVDVVSTCECLVTDPSFSLIAPGDKASFRIDFDSAGYSGDIRMDLIVRSDSPNLNKALFAVTGEVISGEESGEQPDMKILEELHRNAGLKAEYYYHPGCKECLEFIYSTVPQMMEDLREPLDFIPLDITEPDNYERLTAELDRYGVELVGTPVCIIGSTVLQGEEITALSYYGAVERTAVGKNETAPKASDEKSPAAGGISTRKVISRISLPAVLAAGLIDGVNPCAFATIIFLISALQLAGRNRRDIAFIGVSFALAVFVSYYLIGLGLFSVLRITSTFAVISRVIEGLLIILLFILACLSLYDFIQSLRGRTSKMLLQLPLSVKQRIHRTIRVRLRTAGLIIGSFSMGVLISLFELGCTGQIYLPAITYMVKTENNRGYTLLLVYNFAFIMPLIAVMMAAYFGLASKKIAGIFSRKMPYVKLATTVLFIIMAIGLLLL